MRVLKFDQYIGQLAGHQVVGGPEPDQPGQLRAREEPVGLGLGIEDRAGEADHRGAICGERQIAGIAAEQLSADGLFQPRDMPAHRRLPQPENPSRRRKTTRAFNCQKSSQQLGV
ncbi:Uncharacterised protein [Mycobacteroides abscessus subsp. abscessus]|nr:Uncharacterised protein [Mycobacteroides abscessus subsp. abscessus]